MPRRRRRDEAPRRRWPIYLLLVLGVLAGVALWAYSPNLPAEMLIARYANDRSKFIDVVGGRAHVREQGDLDGIPIVLIHGSLGLAPYVGGLGPGARRQGPPDLGRSAGARPDRRLGARRIHDRRYADFIEVLVDALNLDRFVLVGHSMGGAVA